MVALTSPVTTGASLAAFTVIRNVLDAVSALSDTVSVMSEKPLWFAPGVTTTDLLAPAPGIVMFDTGTTEVFDDATGTVSAAAAVSTSATVKPCAVVGVSSAVVSFTRALMLGASFTGLIVKRKVSVDVDCPSETVNVIVVLPAWFAAG